MTTRTSSSATAPDVPLFRGLSSTATQAILDAGRPLHASTGQHLCRQGDEATRFLLIQEGSAKLTQVTRDGHQVLVRFMKPGDCCGIIAAYEGAEYQASVRVLDACTALTWDHRTLRQLLLDHPKLALNALAMLAEQCQSWQRRYREVTTQRVEQRVALTLLRLARHAGQRVDSGVLIDLPLSREDLAEMTGTTLYTVSRIFQRWQRQDIVSLGRKRVVVRDGHGLVLIAENGAALSGPDTDDP